MKKTIFSFLFLAALACQACWFTSENFNGNYIAGVNNYIEHYTPAAAMVDAVYLNNQLCSMPLTVYVKVSPIAGKITEAVLQYRTGTQGKWVTAKTIKNPSWEIQFDQPVPLFGRNVIDLDVPAGTIVQIRLYLSDGMFETGSLSASLTGVEFLSSGSDSVYAGGWTPPFTMQVVTNGVRRAK